VKHFEDYANSVIHKLSIPEWSLIVDVGATTGPFEGIQRQEYESFRCRPAIEIAKKATEAARDSS